MTPTTRPHLSSVVVFGDWHGNHQWSQYALTQALNDYPGAHIVHVGDFGLWDTKIFPKEKYDGEHEEFYAEHGHYPTKGYVHELNKILEEHDSYLYTVLGNHENYWDITDTYGYYGFYLQDSCPEGMNNKDNIYVSGDEVEHENRYDDHGFITSDLFPRIKVIPRGHYWTWGDTAFASLGGAASIDRIMRSRGLSWWEEELPTMNQARRLVGHVGKRPVDVMINHESPTTVVEQLYGKGETKGVNFGEEMMNYALEGSNVIEYAVNELKPRTIIGGHHHVRKDFIHEPTGVLAHILDRDESFGVIKNITNMTPRDVYVNNHIVLDI